jgi:hypothetical protein
LEAVEDIDDPLLLRFPKGAVTGELDHLCVSFKSFDFFVRSAAEKGQNLLALTLDRVMCKSGRERNFVLSMEVWVLFILEEHSQEMRNKFGGYLECSIKRMDQLKGMKKDDDLWLRVLVWISDFLDFSNAQERLVLPPVEGTTPFMSPFYFSKEEAEFLGDLLMPNTTNLSDTMSGML